MSSYVLTTGLICAAIIIAHLARAPAEGLSIAKDPGLMLSTAVAAAASVWARQLLRPRVVSSGDNKP
jgi:hypothetical protein